MMTDEQLEAIRARCAPSADPMERWDSLKCQEDRRLLLEEVDLLITDLDSTRQHIVRLESLDGLFREFHVGRGRQLDVLRELLSARAALRVRPRFHTGGPIAPGQTLRPTVEPSRPESVPAPDPGLDDGGWLEEQAQQHAEPHPCVGIGHSFAPWKPEDGDQTCERCGFAQKRVPVFTLACGHMHGRYGCDLDVCRYGVSQDAWDPVAAEIRQHADSLARALKPTTTAPDAPLDDGDDTAF